MTDQWTKVFRSMRYKELKKRDRIIRRKGGYDVANPYHSALKKELRKRKLEDENEDDER